MRDFVRLIRRLTPSALRRTFLEIVQRKRDNQEIGTREEVLEEIGRLQRVAAEAERFQPTFRRRVVGNELTKVRSEEHFNLPMEEALIDINVLYDYAGQMARILSQHKRIHQGEMARVDDAIAHLASRIQGYLEALSDTSYTRVIHEGFARAKNAVRDAQKAAIDSRIGTLKLAPRARRRAHEYQGVNPTTAEVTVLTPTGGLANFSTFAPKKAIDPDPSSFWATVFLADEPVVTVYNNGSYDGVLVELTITLPYVESVNEIRFLPFGQYPVTVLDVQTHTESGTWTTFNGFGGPETGLTPMEWSGVPESAKQVKFVLQQESYRQVDYLLPRYLVDKQNLWIQVTDAETRLVVEDADLYDRQRLESGFNPSYNVYLEGLRRLSERIPDLDLEPYPGEEYNVTKRFVDAVSKTMSPGNTKARQLLVKHLTGEDIEPDVDETVRMEAAEYVLGAYNVEINHVEYFKEGEYSSPKYRCPGTLNEVVFDATEDIPATDTGWNPVSVEYELELAESRTVNVCPSSTDRIEDARLLVHPRSLEGATRLASHATPSLVVRASGRILPATLYAWSQRADGRLEIVMSAAEYKKSTVYTVSYDLDANNHPSQVLLANYVSSIDIRQELTKTDDGGMLQLRHQPYVCGAVVNSADFNRDPEAGAVWKYITDTPAVYDGRYYSTLNAMVGVACADDAVTITLSNVTGLPVGAGTILIGEEQITYVNIVGNNLTGCNRGQNATTAAPHSVGAPVIGRREYSPILVTVNGVRAINISNYDTSRHPAFSPATDEDQRLEYVHMGDRLYFNRKIGGSKIVVDYGTLAKYLRVNARLRANTIQRALYTPVVDDYSLRIKHTVL